MAVCAGPQRSLQGLPAPAIKMCLGVDAKDKSWTCESSELNILVHGRKKRGCMPHSGRPCLAFADSTVSAAASEYLPTWSELYIQVMSREASRILWPSGEGGDPTSLRQVAQMLAPRQRQEMPRHWQCGAQTSSDSVAAVLFVPLASCLHDFHTVLSTAV